MLFRVLKPLLILLAGMAVVASSAAAAVKPQPAANPQVFLFRGLANIFSLGMDDLAKQINAAGVPAKVYNHAWWPTIADEVIKTYKANPKTTRPIVLIGHSLGANAAMLMGKQLADAGVPVDLVVTFDPTVSGPLSNGVKRYLNLYQSHNGWSEALPSGKRVENSDTNKRTDIKAPISHVTIDKSQVLHQEVVQAILKLVNGPRKTMRTAAPKKPAPPQAAAAN